MLSGKKEQKMPKIQILIFRNSLNNFGRDPPWEYTWILGDKCGVFQRRSRLKRLLPYDPMWTKSKNIGQNPKFEISQFFEQLWKIPILGICMIFWIGIWSVLSEKMSFEIFALIWSHVNESKKKKKKT